jgi:hypothetical protein
MFVRWSFGSAYVHQLWKTRVTGIRYRNSASAPTPGLVPEQQRQTAGQLEDDGPGEEQRNPEHTPLGHLVLRPGRVEQLQDPTDQEDLADQDAGGERSIMLKHCDSAGPAEERPHGVGGGLVRRGRAPAGGQVEWMRHRNTLLSGASPGADPPVRARA